MDTLRLELRRYAHGFAFASEGTDVPNAFIVKKHDGYVAPFGLDVSIIDTSTPAHSAAKVNSFCLLSRRLPQLEVSIHECLRCIVRAHRIDVEVVGLGAAVALPMILGIPVGEVTLLGGQHPEVVMLDDIWLAHGDAELDLGSLGTALLDDLVGRQDRLQRTSHVAAGGLAELMHQSVVGKVLRT